MTRVERGRVRSVAEVYDGSSVTVAASIGASSVTVESTQDFDEAGGNFRTPVGTIVAYLSVDDDTGVITLSGTLAAGLDADDRLVVYPLAGDRIAQIMVDDVGDEGDALLARVAHPLWERITVGTRAEDESEWVKVVNEGDGWVLTDLLGSPPLNDTSVSDGYAPSESPVPTADGADRALRVSWTAITNADPVTYDVHIGTTNSFTASASTLFGSTSGTVMIVTHLGQAGSARLVNGTTYYVRIQARDADGSATISAAVAGLPRAGTDGLVPGTPGAPTLTGGIGVLVVRWTNIANVDPLFHDVHISTSSGFTPSATTLLGRMFGEFYVIRSLTAAQGGAALVFGTTYYVKLVAFDEDGQGGTSAQASGGISQAGTTDIVAGNITAALLESVMILTSRLIAGAADSGARIALGFHGGSSYGLRAYNGAGTITFELKGADGSITMTGGIVSGGTISSAAISAGTIDGTTITGGTVQTSATGSRVVMTEAGSEQDRITWREGAVSKASAQLVNAGGGIYNLAVRGLGTTGMSVGGQDAYAVYGSDGAMSITASGNIAVTAAAVTIRKLVQAGTYTLSVGAGNRVSAQTSVTFATAWPASTTPRVTCSGKGNSDPDTRYLHTAYATSNTGATFRATSTSAGDASASAVTLNGAYIVVGPSA